MAAIIDRCAALWRIVHGAEVLPFACAHFGTGVRRACRRVGEEGDDHDVGLLDQEAGEFVEPYLLGCVGWGMCELHG